jgi:hypothetical protein
MAAGVADALVCHPIDRVKTQFHVNPGRNGSMGAALAAQWRTGGLPLLYRGILPACLRPQALCMYAGNEQAKARARACTRARCWLARRALTRVFVPCFACVCRDSVWWRARAS